MSRFITAGNFKAYQTHRTERIKTFLAQLLPENPIAPPTAPRLYEAMRYCVLNGGKRVRPLLVYAVGEALGHSLSLLDAPAAAVELIHCYSLIHDDLPAMDNDDLRRGKPTCHKAFDEPTAILAGDALQALAFEILTDPRLHPAHPTQCLKMVNLLAKHIGMDGMVGGQALDLSFENSDQALSAEDLAKIHHKKTGALIETSVMLGALPTSDALEADGMTQLQHYARCIGLAFQIQDDILDLTSSAEILGKTIGKDEKSHKATFPLCLGIKAAKQYAEKLHQDALNAIAFLNGRDHYLNEFSAWFIHRIQ